MPPLPSPTPEELTLLRRRAGEGDRSSQARLCYIHAKGLGTPRDTAAARYWFRKAAEQGESTAQYNLAISLYYGTGGPVDRREATVWFRKAAAQGLPQARKIIESNYATVTQDESAPSDFLLAVFAEPNRPASSSPLSVSVPPPEETTYVMTHGASNESLLAAAEAGDVYSQFLLSARLRAGQAGPRDRKQGVYWLIRAAAGGHPEAQRIYARGLSFGGLLVLYVRRKRRRGVPSDPGANL